MYQSAKGAQDCDNWYFDYWRKGTHISINSGGWRVVGSDHPVIAEPSDDVILPCHISPRLSAVDMEVRWFRERFDRPVHLYLNQRDWLKKQDSDYQGRTALSHSALQTGDISLHLRNLRPSDRGVYTCYVDDGSWNEEGQSEVIVAEISRWFCCISVLSRALSRDLQVVLLYQRSVSCQVQRSPGGSAVSAFCLVPCPEISRWFCCISVLSRALSRDLQVVLLYQRSVSCPVQRSPGGSAVSACCLVPCPEISRWFCCISVLSRALSRDLQVVLMYQRAVSCPVQRSPGGCAVSAFCLVPCPEISRWFCCISVLSRALSRDLQVVLLYQRSVSCPVQRSPGGSAVSAFCLVPCPEISRWFCCISMLSRALSRDLQVVLLYQHAVSCPVQRSPGGSAVSACCLVPCPEISRWFCCISVLSRALSRDLQVVLLYQRSVSCPVQRSPGGSAVSAFCLVPCPEISRWFCCISVLSRALSRDLQVVLLYQRSVSCPVQRSPGGSAVSAFCLVPCPEISRWFCCISVLSRALSRDLQVVLLYQRSVSCPVQRSPGGSAVSAFCLVPCPEISRWFCCISVLSRALSRDLQVVLLYQRSVSCPVQRSPGGSAVSAFCLVPCPEISRWFCCISVLSRALSRDLQVVLLYQRSVSCPVQRSPGGSAVSAFCLVPCPEISRWFCCISVLSRALSRDLQVVLLYQRSVSCPVQRSPGGSAVSAFCLVPCPEISRWFCCISVLSRALSRDLQVVLLYQRSVSCPVQRSPGGSAVSAFCLVPCPEISRWFCCISVLSRALSRDLQVVLLYQRSVSCPVQRSPGGSAVSAFCLVPCPEISRWFCCISVLSRALSRDLQVVLLYQRSVSCPVQRSPGGSAVSAFCLVPCPEISRWFCCISVLSRALSRDLQVVLLYQRSVSCPVQRSPGGSAVSAFTAYDTF
ncbi:UNVERIFIED_CONTAM: hypothetical protein FKN15_071254 [Acipenser sinensis]